MPMEEEDGSRIHKFITDLEDKFLTDLEDESVKHHYEEEISKYVGNGIIPCGDLVTGVMEDIKLHINQTRNSPTASLVTVLLEGRFM